MAYAENQSKPHLIHEWYRLAQLSSRSTDFDALIFIHGDDEGERRGRPHTCDLLVQHNTASS